MLKTGWFLELVIIVSIWSLLFVNNRELGGFTRNGMIIYFLIGNLIGHLATFFLGNSISSDIRSSRTRLLSMRPLAYAREVLLKRVLRNIFPFILAVAFNACLLIFFINSISFNTDPLYITVIIAMIVLAFIIELLIALLLRLNVFWTMEAKDTYVHFNRARKLLSGAYFPLSFLPSSIFNISLVMPFAYSFYVPTGLYLKGIDIGVGIRGLGIELLWIIILYSLVKITINKRLKV